MDLWQTMFFPKNTAKPQVVLVLAKHQRSCGGTNNALLPRRYCKYIVRGRCLQIFLHSVDNATDSSGGAWLASPNSSHTTFYNRTVLFDVYLFWHVKTRTAFHTTRLRTRTWVVFIRAHNGKHLKAVYRRTWTWTWTGVSNLISSG